MPLAFCPLAHALLFSFLLAYLFVATKSKLHEYGLSVKQLHSDDGISIDYLGETEVAKISVTKYNTSLGVDIFPKIVNFVPTTIEELCQLSNRALQISPGIQRAREADPSSGSADEDRTVAVSRPWSRQAI